MSRERVPRALGEREGTSVHPLAIASLSSSMLAYGSAFVGSAALVFPAIGIALVAVVTGVLARRAIGQAPATFGGKALATAGLLAGAAFVVLGAVIVALARPA